MAPRKKKSKAGKASSNFPTAAIHKALAKGRSIKGIDPTAPLYLAAVMEYTAAEILELAGNVARGKDKKVIDADDVAEAVRKDKELTVLTGK